jgi:hypothetical protein
MLSMCAACTCTMRSHADEKGDLHVTQCSHFVVDVDDADDEDVDGDDVEVEEEEIGAGFTRPEAELFGTFSAENENERCKHETMQNGFYPLNRQVIAGPAYS